MNRDAGTLRDRLGVLHFSAEAKECTWIEVRKAWGRVELTGKSNLFSAVGIGARDATIILRRQSLTLDDALLWQGKHLFLTEIVEVEPGWLEVKAAVVELKPCIEAPDREPQGRKFPGVLTEKYVGHTQDKPMAYNEIRYVLVTPKTLELKPGGIVKVAEEDYWVKVPHVLDPHKNEYEIGSVREH